MMAALQPVLQELTVTVLSDRTIKEELATGRLVIDPLDENDIQPASVDLHLDRVFRIFRVTRRPYVDVREPMEDLTELVSIEDDEPFIIQPGTFVLGSTLESVTLPDDIVARVDGRSSLGRLGLLVHATAGYVDPGWMGKLTLELSNQSQMPIALYYGMKISQISFLRLSTPVERPYGSEGLASKYQGQTGPTPSRIFQDFRSAGGGCVSDAEGEGR
jgi:dCTP deaminase